MIKEDYTCDGQMDIFSFLDKENQKEKEYPNCSAEEVKYIFPILKIDVFPNMREQIYKEWKSGMSDADLCKCLKYYYKPWSRDNEQRFNFPEDMIYQSAITYPDGMELRRAYGDTTGCNVNTWSHVLLMIKDMIAAEDYVEIPEKETHPTLIRGYTCEHDYRCWCNRYGHELPIEEYKNDLIKGFSCAGCCYNCSQAPMYGGKCKWDCRIMK